MNKISTLVFAILVIFGACNKEENFPTLTISNPTNQNFQIYGVPECDGDSKACMLMARNFTISGYNQIKIRSDKNGVFNLSFVNATTQIEQSTLYFKGEKGKNYEWNYGDPADQVKEISPSSGSGNTGGNCDLSNYDGPEFDIQIDGQCKAAYAYRCAGDDQAADAACSVYKQWQLEDPSIPDCPYCP